MILLVVVASVCVIALTYDVKKEEEEALARSIPPSITHKDTLVLPSILRHTSLPNDSAKSDALAPYCTGT